MQIYPFTATLKNSYLFGYFFEGGCLTLLSKYVGDPIKNIASKMIAKQAVSKEYGDEANRRATFMYWWTFQLSDNRTAYFARWGFFYTGNKNNTHVLRKIYR